MHHPIMIYVHFAQTDLSSLKYQLVTGGKCPSIIRHEIVLRLTSGRSCESRAVYETKPLNSIDRHTVKIIGTDGK